MSLILPFKALRPSIDKASDVIAPPYDVLDSGEAREMAKDKPYSFLHISKPEIDLAEPFNRFCELVITIAGLLKISFNLAAIIPIRPSLMLG